MQLTWQKGIHSRYESKMISIYFDSITVKRSQLHKVKNVGRFIFDYMYFNYQFSDSLLYDDLASFNASGHEYVTKYYQSLLSRSRQSKIKLMTNAAKSTAEMIRTAWIEAGKPRIPKEISF